MQQIRKDDEVIVIAGKDKKKVGKVLKVFPREDSALVEGVNLKIKHTRPNPQLQQEGGRVSKEAPIHISNLAIYNNATKKADKVKIKLEDGNKVRVYKSNGEKVGSL